MKKILSLLVLMCMVAIFCAAQEQNAPKKHAVVKGETLWGLSGKYYNNPFKWPKIYDANKGNVKDPHWIYPKNELVIPDVKEEAVSQPVSKPEEVVSDKTVPFEEEGVEGAVSSSEVAEGVSEDYKKAEVEALRQAAKTQPLSRDRYDVLEDMPIDMVWGIPAANSKIMPEDWKEDGYISAASLEDAADDLASLGDLVMIKITGDVEPAPGDMFVAYRRMNETKDDEGNEGMEVVRSAILKIMEVKGSYAKAEIVRVYSPVTRKDIVKKMEGSK